MNRVNEQKYLVTWIEANGFVRGQATKTIEDAARMYHHAVSLNPIYAEVRHIGGLAKSNGTTLQYEQPEG